jgi:putative endonuclease
VRRFSPSAPRPPPRPNTRALGSAAERRARRHYLLRGYRVLDANAWGGAHELDLVLRRGGVLVFCEVKFKGGAGFGDPVDMVDDEKLRRVRAAASMWLERHRELADLRMRIDVVAVRGRRLQRVTVEE